MKQFKITGYATSKSGLTIGICKVIRSGNQKDATAQVMREAQQDGYLNIRFNLVREVKQ